jgi:hypothetical protein
MDIRNLISKFITNLFEKNYAEANKGLQTIVEAKVKEKIKKTAKNLNLEKEVKKTPSKKTPSKKKLSPAQKKIAGAAAPYDKITGDDFKALRNKKNSKKGKK